MNDDYSRIAQAIHFIRSQVGNQPTLKEVATAVQLSEYHFQRLFCRWAGVTPKRYLQALTLAQAKVLLRAESASTLSASLDLGLSSSSRVYDHFVQIEAVTPSEYRQRGAGLKIVFGYHDTVYGRMFVALTTRGICQLDFVPAEKPLQPLQQLKDNWPQADISEDLTQTEKIMSAVFTEEKSVPLSLWVQGTNFQVSVWRALLNLSRHQLVCYSDIAREIGKPKASRAVGSAVGANPVALIIPCHRVLRQNGELGGYRWGEEKKHLILAREMARSDIRDD